METPTVPTDQSRTQINLPHLVGDILTEMLHSDSPLAKGYRKFLASNETDAEKGKKNI